MDSHQKGVHLAAARQWRPTGTEVSLWLLLLWGLLLLLLLCLSLLFTSLVFESQSKQNMFQEDTRMHNLLIGFTEMSLTLCKCFFDSLCVRVREGGVFKALRVQSLTLKRPTAQK